MSAPRPYETDSFHPLGSICYIKSFLYICQSVPATSSKWYVKVCLAGSYLTIAHVLFRNNKSTVENDYSSYFASYSSAELQWVLSVFHRW